MTFRDQQGRRIGDFHAESVRRLPRRDRSWRTTTIAKAIGGLPPPSVDQLRQQLYELISPAAHHEARNEARSEAHSGWRGSGRGNRSSSGHGGMLRLLDTRDAAVGRPVAADLRAFCDALIAVDDTMVGTVDDTMVGGGLDRHVARIRHQKLGGLPFRLTIGPDWIGLLHNHAIGDGHTSFRLLLDLAAGATPDYLISANRSGFPLLRALLRTYLGHPRAAIAVLRQPRPPLPALSGGETTPIRDDVDVVAARSDEHYLPSLRQKRAANADRASVFAHLIARTFKYLNDQHVAVHPGFTAVVNVRRYLGGNRDVLGNFSAGSFVECGPAPTPQEVAQALQTLVGNGRPLLSMLISTLLWADQEVKGWTVDPAARILLSFSHQGKVTVPTVPVDAQPDLEIVTMGFPLGPYGISINTSEVGGRLNVSASHRPDTVPTVLVQGLVQALAGVQSMSKNRNTT